MNLDKLNNEQKINLTPNKLKSEKILEEKKNLEPTEKPEPWPFDEISEEAANIIIDIVKNDEQFKKYSEVLKAVFPLEALAYPGLPPDILGKTPTKENKT
jgi:hypothetical protein